MTIRKFIICFSFFILSGCFGPKYDNTNDETRKNSYQKILSSIPEEERNRFDELVILYFNPYEYGGDTITNSLNDFNGMRAKEIYPIILEHEKLINELQRQDELLYLRSLYASAIEHNYGLSQRENISITAWIGGGGVVSNNSDLPFRALYVSIKVYEKETDYVVYETFQNINFGRLLKNGKQIEFEFNDRGFVKYLQMEGGNRWAYGVKLEPIEGYVFEIFPLRIIGDKGQDIYSLMTSDQMQTYQYLTNKYPKEFQKFVSAETQQQ